MKEANVSDPPLVLHVYGIRFILLDLIEEDVYIVVLIYLNRN